MSHDISEYIKPLSYKNLHPILQGLKHNHYLLLGESTHGTEEYFAHRLAISIIMIKDFGYNTVLFEMEWSLGYQLNLYIHSKINKNINTFFNEVFQSFPKWMGNNEYIMHLILFMKKWNDTHSKKVYFYGIDCQDLELAEQNLCHDKTLHCSVIQQIIQNHGKMNKSTSYWNQRDKFWHHVIRMIKHRRDSKFILWAHNSHIGNVKANYHQPNKINIGYLLDSSHKSFKIGYSTFQGTVKASKKWGTPGRKYTLKKAIPNSYEHIFHELSTMMNVPNFIYICNPRIHMKHYFRYVGVVYDPIHEMQAHYQMTDINKEFNIVIYLDKTSYLKTPPQVKSKSLPQYYALSKRLNI